MSTDIKLDNEQLTEALNNKVDIDKILQYLPITGGVIDEHLLIDKYNGTNVEDMKHSVGMSYKYDVDDGTYGSWMNSFILRNNGSAEMRSSSDHSANSQLYTLALDSSGNITFRNHRVLTDNDVILVYKRYYTDSNYLEDTIIQQYSSGQTYTLPSGGTYKYWFACKYWPTTSTMGIISTPSSDNDDGVCTGTASGGTTINIRLGTSDVFGIIVRVK